MISYIVFYLIDSHSYRHAWYMVLGLSLPGNRWVRTGNSKGAQGCNVDCYVFGCPLCRRSPSLKASQVTPRGPKMTRANTEAIRCIPWGKRWCQFHHGGFCVSSSFALESAWLSLYWRMHKTLVFFAFAWCLAYSLAQSMSYSIWRHSLFARGLSFTSMLSI